MAIISENKLIFHVVGYQQCDLRDRHIRGGKRKDPFCLQRWGNCLQEWLRWFPSINLGLSNSRRNRFCVRDESKRSDGYLSHSIPLSLSYSVCLFGVCCREPDERPKGPWEEVVTRRCVKPSPFFPWSPHSLSVCAPFLRVFILFVFCVSLFIFCFDVSNRARPIGFILIQSNLRLWKFSCLYLGRSVEPSAVDTHTHT